MKHLPFLLTGFLSFLALSGAATSGNTVEEKDQQQTETPIETEAHIVPGTGGISETEEVVPQFGGTLIIEKAIGGPGRHSVETFLGKEQSEYGSYNEGPFFNCFGTMPSDSIGEYTQEEFFNNRVFSLFKIHREELNIKGKKIWVITKSCGGTGQVAFPFVQTSRRERFYAFNGVIYVLKRID